MDICRSRTHVLVPFTLQLQWNWGCRVTRGAVACSLTRGGHLGHERRAHGMKVDTAGRVFCTRRRRVGIRAGRHEDRHHRNAGGLRQRRVRWTGPAVRCSSPPAHLSIHCGRRRRAWRIRGIRRAPSTLSLRGAQRRRQTPALVWHEGRSHLDGGCRVGFASFAMTCVAGCLRLAHIPEHRRRTLQRIADPLAPRHARHVAAKVE